jgi:hypothetical protein
VVAAFSCGNVRRQIGQHGFQVALAVTLCLTRVFVICRAS